MKLSVIIPFWKYKIFLEDCLNSLSLSTFQDFETILVLDKDAENVNDLIEKYQQLLNLKIVRSDEHSVAIARNKGLSEAKGEYVYFLDSDDYVLEDTFAVLNEAMDAEPDSDVYAGTRVSTWYKRVNFLDRDNTRKFEKLDRVHNNWIEKFDSKFDHHDIERITSNEKTTYINLLLEAKNFYNLTILSHAYRTEYLRGNQIVFDESMTYYVDQPFLVQVINHNPVVTECKQAYYLKRKHNDPYNTPALNREDDEVRYTEQVDRTSALQICYINTD
jgi:CDP-glycerol glycerophosphotransferase